MIFTPLAVEGAYRVDLERFRDDRGSFARAYCGDEFAEHGLEPPVAQANLSTNPDAGTMRGLHWQAPPAGEAKFIRAVTGRLYDVVLDVRDGSPTRGAWAGVEISAEDGGAVYVPAGCAHGYLTLEPETTAFYLVSTPYTPGAERGLRWDDPALGIEWPITPSLVSDKDAGWPLLDRPLTEEPAR